MNGKDHKQLIALVEHDRDKATEIYEKIKDEKDRDRKLGLRDITLSTEYITEIGRNLEADLLQMSSQMEIKQELLKKTMDDEK
jgi:hypothetical protein